MILPILTTLTFGYQLDEKQNGRVTTIDEKNILKQLLYEDKKMLYEIIEVMDEKEEFEDKYYETEEHAFEKRSPWFLWLQRRASSCTCDKWFLFYFFF